MKSICLAIISVFALTAAAEAAGCRQMICYNNPSCQQLRNAGKCAAARAAGGTMPSGGGFSGRGQPGGSGARY
jgi:hypothetical protein